MSWSCPAIAGVACLDVHVGSGIDRVEGEGLFREVCLVGSIVGSETQAIALCFIVVIVGRYPVVQNFECFTVDHDFAGNGTFDGRAPGSHWIGTSFVPDVADGWEVLAIGAPGAENTQYGAEEDVESVMAGVHDARHGDARGSQRRDQDDHGAPDFTFLVQDMELAGKIEGQKKETGKRRG